VVESGFKYVATTWYGLLAPAGTPRPIIDRLNKNARALLGDPAMQAQLAPQGVVLTPSTPEEFGAFLRAEVATWAKVVQDTGARVE
jgi:tripartite-type tricarboxylate transporter receptor subunit TctC